VLTTSILSGQDLKEIPEETPKEWKQFNPDESWIYYYQLFQEYQKLLTSYNELRSNSFDKDEIINTYKERLLATKSYYPTYGFAFNIMGGFDRSLEADIQAGIDFYIYTLKGHLFFPIGLYIKVYEKLGGSIKLGIGFNW